MRRLVKVSVMLVLVAAGLAVPLAPAAPNSEPRRSVPTMIEPNGDETPWLVHPRSFGWSTRGVGGSAYGVGWRHWGSRRSVGRGWTRFCINEGSCGKIHMRIVASRKRGGPPRSQSFYYYCRIGLRGRFDPGSTEPVTVWLPPAEPCEG